LAIADSLPPRFHSVGDIIAFTTPSIAWATVCPLAFAAFDAVLLGKAELVIEDCMASSSSR